MGTRKGTSAAYPGERYSTDCCQVNGILVKVILSPHRESEYEFISSSSSSSYRGTGKLRKFVRMCWAFAGLLRFGYMERFGIAWSFVRMAVS